MVSWLAGQTTYSHGKPSPQIPSPTSTPIPTLRFVSEQSISQDTTLSHLNTVKGITSTLAEDSAGERYQPSGSSPSGPHSRNQDVSPQLAHLHIGKTKCHPLQNIGIIPELPPPSPILKPIGRQRTFSSNQSTLVDIAPTYSWAPLPPNQVSWKTKLRHRLPRGTLGKTIVELIGVVIGIATTFTWTYRSYKLSLWQAEQAFYDHCMEVEPGRPGFDDCSIILQEALPRPPYTSLVSQINLQKRGRTANVIPSSSASWSRGHIIITISILAVVSAIAYLLLTFWQPRFMQRLGDSWYDYRASQLDPFRPFTPRYSRQHDSQGSLCARSALQGRPSTAEGFVATRNNDIQSAGADAKPSANSGVKSRVFPVVSGRLCITTYDEGLEHGSMLTERTRHTPLPCKEIRDQQRCHESCGAEHDSLATLGRWSQSSKRTAETKNAQNVDESAAVVDNGPSSRSSNSGDLIGALRHKIHLRIPRLSHRFASLSSVNDFKSLTAPDDTGVHAKKLSNGHVQEQTPTRTRRKTANRRGFVAIGLAQSGGALASLTGGIVAKEVLVQCNEGTKDVVAAMNARPLRDQALRLEITVQGQR